MPSADQLVAVVWRRRLTFLLTFICVLGAVAAVTYSLPKTYSSSAYLIVNAIKPATSDFAAQQVSQVDTQTAAELLQTRNAADQVAGQLPFPGTGQQVQGEVSITPLSNTQLVLITAYERTPQRAQQLADTYARVFERRTAPTIGFARITLGEPAPLITNPTSPRTHLFLVIGALLALLAGAGAAILRERFDRTLRIEPFASELLGLPILARVPTVETPRLPGRRGRPNPQRVRFLESFRWVFAHLAFVSGGDRPRSIAVVSSAEQDGKSTVCLALANAAEEGISGSVLLVDADMRRPTLAARLNIPEPLGRGLSGYLGHPEGDAIRQLVVQSPESAVRLVPAGPTPPNPSSLLGLPVFAQFLRSALRDYSCVIFDTPPIRAGADASLVAAHTDGAILVVDGTRGNRDSIEWSLQQLRRAQVNVLGVIINRVAKSDDLGYYYDQSSPGRGSRRRGGRGRGPAEPAGGVAGDDRSASASPSLSAE